MTCDHHLTNQCRCAEGFYRDDSDQCVDYSECIHYCTLPNGQVNIEHCSNVLNNNDHMGNMALNIELTLNLYVTKRKQSRHLSEFRDKY